VVNIDDESTPTMLEHFKGEKYITYGIDANGHRNYDCDLCATDIKYHSDNTTFDIMYTRCDLETGDETFYCFSDVWTEDDIDYFNLPIKGHFNIYNTLAAIGVAKALGLPRYFIRKAVSNLKGVPGRIQSVVNDKGMNIFVDYAHSPDGISNILSSVRDFTTGRLIIIFGCGGDKDAEKRPIMGRIAGELSNYAILTSDNPRTEDPITILSQIETGIKETGTPYEVCENRREAIFKGIKMLKSDDALVIAGKGHEDYQIIGTVKHHFDDYEVALEALSEL